MVFGAVKEENVICRLGRFCVFGIKCLHYICLLYGMSGVVGAVCGCRR